MMSRTWTAPAAWRNVPQVVATGKSRLGHEERDDADDDERSKREGSAGPGQGDQADQRDREPG